MEEELRGCKECKHYINTFLGEACDLEINKDITFEESQLARETLLTDCFEEKDFWDTVFEETEETTFSFTQEDFDILNTLLERELNNNDTDYSLVTLLDLKRKIELLLYM